MSTEAAPAVPEHESLPFITDSLPGIGGQIRAESSHFIVDEIPLYEPVDEGEHIYVAITREGWTTKALQRKLVELFALRDVDVGYAGLKDKHARATQTFSLLLPKSDVSEVAEQIRDTLPVEVLWARRHRNKLRVGHLLGNRFQIVVANPEKDALARAADIARALNEEGMPNYYGVQRFGMRGDNPRQGREVLLGRGPRKQWLRRFLLSAYQSALFNVWLAERIRRGWFQALLTGDIAKKTDTGGLFEVEDAAVEAPRFERGEITYTGPIYGARMRWPGGRPGELERALLEDAGVTEEMLRRARLNGSRRAARLMIEDLEIAPTVEGLRFTLSLPKGAYATTLLREFVKTEPALDEEDG
jgi:tRNA pseudouridine13 synthase